MYQVLTGEEIQGIRKYELYVTLGELGRLADITPRTLIKYEHNLSRPKRWFLEKLADIRREFKAKPLLIQLRKFTAGCRKRLELIKARGRRTQYQIAKLLGVSDSTVSRWESGVIIPLNNRMEQLAELYRVAKEILFPDVFGQKNTTVSAAA